MNQTAQPMSLAGMLIRCTLMALALILISFSARAQWGEESYTVEINKGKLIRLDHAASSVIVADPTVADIQVVSPTLIYVNGRRTGETSVFAIDKSDNEILNATVTVTHNLTKLNKAVKAMMPDSNVQFDTVDGALVIKGQADSPLEAEDIRRMAAPFVQQNETLLNMLRVNGSDQVMLKVKVAEVSRNELKRFGINLAAVLTSGNFVFSLAQGRPLFDAATGAALRSGDDNSVLVDYNNGNLGLDGIIDALEDDGLVTILAEPNLTSMSGKTANFLAGGEFPIPIVGEDNQVTVQYQPFGVSLSFTPQVLSKQKISLTVAPEVSTLSQIGSIEASGFNIPSLITRRASTTVELGSGQTFAIAGLLQNSTGNDVSKFPWLGDVPILGALFRSNEFRHDQSELVILVTPYIVSGDTAYATATPLDSYVPVNDLSRILFGKMYEEDPQTPATPPTKGKQMASARDIKKQNEPQLNGPLGYVLK